jgi:hypothetical protein
MGVVFEAKPPGVPQSSLETYVRFSYEVKVKVWAWMPFGSINPSPNFHFALPKKQNVEFQAKTVRGTLSMGEVLNW